MVLHYKSHRLAEAGVDVTLQDIQWDAQVVLHYRIDAETGVVSRAATVTNRTEAKIVLEQVARSSTCE